MILIIISIFNNYLLIWIPKIVDIILVVRLFIIFISVLFMIVFVEFINLMMPHDTAIDHKNKYEHDQNSRV